MKRLRQMLHNFFFPPATAPQWVRVLPYAILGLLTLFVAVSGAYAWDYTNSPPFCGETCHTMPPEYSAYEVSPHARISCTECHIGREFVGNQILRKAGDVKHIIALAFTTYEFPITAHEMRPARETCEKCHSPEKFSDDSFRQIYRYGDDKNNTLTTISLFVKTGGGNERQGLGRGIHWHVQNKILYYATDKSEQNIPYVRVYDEKGAYTEYLDTEATLDPATLAEADLREMDCITCHNRITHLVNMPDAAMDKAMRAGEIDPAIPDIHLKGVEVLSVQYATQEQGLNGIAGLDGYYRMAYPDYYAANFDKISYAIAAIKNIFSESVYIEQKSDWYSHPNNVGHKNFPGCFRCHDGKHMTTEQETIRLECNLCHSIPVVSGPQDFVTEIEISRGPEPASHLNSNWIAGHREHLDKSCSLCHTTSNPGGTDNTSFCSNSACHASTWTYAGLDAPAVAQAVIAQLPTPTPAPTPEPIVGVPTYANLRPIFDSTCGACHGPDLAAGLDLLTYAGVLKGGDSGPAIIPGNAAKSLIVEMQTNEHFGQLTAEELELVRQWIEAGAPEQ